jgi:hypothetical protein
MSSSSGLLASGSEASGSGDDVAADRVVCAAEIAVAWEALTCTQQTLVHGDPLGPVDTDSNHELLAACLRVLGTVRHVPAASVFEAAVHLRFDGAEAYCSKSQSQHMITNS